MARRAELVEAQAVRLGHLPTLGGFEDDAQLHPEVSLKKTRTVPVLTWLLDSALPLEQPVPPFYWSFRGMKRINGRICHLVTCRLMLQPRWILNEISSI